MQRKMSHSFVLEPQKALYNVLAHAVARLETQ